MRAVGFSLRHALARPPVRLRGSPVASPTPEKTCTVNPRTRTGGGRNTLTSPIGVHTIGLKRITATIVKI